MPELPTGTSLSISPAEVEAVLATGLIAQLDADLLSRYPGEPVNGIEPAAFRAAQGFFVLARWESQPVGCGAFRPYDAATVEIKRMFVHRDFRGRGIARAVLAAVEQEASRRGFTRAILETAFRMPEAIALYRSSRYLDIPRFEPYVESARSVCLGKNLLNQ